MIILVLNLSEYDSYKLFYSYYLFYNIYYNFIMKLCKKIKLILFVLKNKIFLFFYFVHNYFYNITINIRRIIKELILLKFYIYKVIAIYYTILF